MRQNLFLFLCFFIFVGLGNAIAQVTISNVTPNSGSIGTVVTITGTNFSLVPTENLVKFGGVNATVTASTNFTITTKVPFEARYGKITVETACKKAISLSNFIPIVELRDTIPTNTLLTNDKQYLLKGIVYVANGSILTIQPGTTIFGDISMASMLIILPGGKIEANGTELDPIVFTSNSPISSRTPGDWAGLHILGNAFVNQPAKPFLERENFLPQFGTTIAQGSNPNTNSNESSGTLRYVRIEYGGRPLSPNNPTNGLTLAGVGSGTTIEYVQVSNCNDDGFQFEGGTVNAKHLISFSNVDDDFDTDFGWGGNVQFALAIRNPNEASQNGSNCIESDNQGTSDPIAGVCDGSTNLGCTRGVFSNVSVFGPREVQTRFISTNYRNSILFRRRTSISVFNSFFSGFRLGFRVDDQPSLDNLTTLSIAKFAYNVLSVPGSTVIGTSTNATDGSFVTNLAGGDATSISNYWLGGNSSINNILSTQVYDNLGINSSLFWGGQTAYPTNPNFALLSGATGSNNLNNGSNFSDPKLTNGFFAPTTYRGAFGSNDWTDSWSNFIPQNLDYKPKPDQSITIASFSPTSASIGATITITGTNFTSATTVSFGGIPAKSFNIVSETSITAIVASGASGDVSVTSQIGGTGILCGFCIKPAKPTINVSLVGSTTTLTSSAASGNQWFLNGAVIPTATNSTYNATTAGTYKVQVTIDNCVSDFSNDTPVVITGDLSAINSTITAYPNPADDHLIIVGLEGETKECIVIDLLGRATTLSLTKQKGAHEASVENFSSGVYLVRVQQSNAVQQIRFVKK
jgi:IPT/TIG domain/Secretion system C-terminal sorting domain